MGNIVKKLLGEAHQDDIRFFIPVTARVWITADDLNASPEVEVLHHLNLPIEEKIKKAKLVAANLATLKLSSASSDEIYLQAVEDGHAEPDRINWEALFNMPGGDEALDKIIS